jgi:hypothetical protein
MVTARVSRRVLELTGAHFYETHPNACADAPRRGNYRKSVCIQKECSNMNKTNLALPHILHLFKSALGFSQ